MPILGAWEWYTDVKTDVLFEHIFLKHFLKTVNKSNQNIQIGRVEENPSENRPNLAEFVRNMHTLEYKKYILK